MIFLAGFLGLLQVGLLPGLIAIRLARWRGPWLTGLVLAFTLSLLVSEKLAFLLAAFGLFRAWLLWPLLLIEITAFIWLYWPWLRQPLPALLATAWAGISMDINATRQRLDEAFKSAPLAASLRLGLSLSVSAAALFLLFYWSATKLIPNPGSVFNTWDAIMSWNRWAVEWTGGSLPLDLGTYPQLGPASWAWIYILQGTSAVQLFAKTLMPFFFLFILLLQLDQARRLRSYGLV